VFRILAGLAAAATGGRVAYGYAANSYYAGPVSDHFDGTRFFVPGHPASNSIGKLLRWRLGGTRAQWPSDFPSPFQDKPPERAGELRVTLIGHASFLIQLAGLNILVDPVFSQRASPVTFAGPSRVNPPGIAFENLPPIDAVLVSHGHYDHLDVETLGRLHRSFRPLIIAPLGNDAVIRDALGDDARAEAYDWGDRVDLGSGVTLHLLPCYHWSARTLLDRRKTLWCAFGLRSPAGTVYHIADTGYGDGKYFRDAATALGAIDLAIIPIGAYEPRWFMQGQHVNPEDSVRLFGDCAAKQAIGHHWGTFQLTDEPIDEPPRRLAEALAQAAIEPARFQPFRPGQVWTRAAS
jgi:L-ascorbate metabolism protein UlaG (beta-lactamase superfamily)